MLEIRIIEPEYYENIPVMYASNLHWIKKHNCSVFIRVWKPSTDAELFTILHEQGHIFWSKIYLKTGQEPCLYKKELDAWRYAFRCIRPEYKFKAMLIALKCLRMYRKFINF